MEPEINNNEEEIVSPLSQFDYESYRDETARKASVSILKLLGEEAENIVPTTKQSGKDIEDSLQTLSQKVMEIMITCNVPDTDRKHVFDSLNAIIFLMSEVIRKHVGAIEKEILSRIVGAKDPGTDKFSYDYSNLGQLFQTLEKVRNDTGNNVEDYYNVNSK